MTSVVLSLAVIVYIAVICFFSVKVKRISLHVCVYLLEGRNEKNVRVPIPMKLEDRKGLEIYFEEVVSRNVAELVLKKSRQHKVLN